MVKANVQRAGFVLEPSKDHLAKKLPEAAVKNLAGSIFKHLQDEGCAPQDIIKVSSQLLGLVTNQLESDNSTSTGA